MNNLVDFQGPCYAEGNERPICENNGSCQVANNLPVCQCTSGWAGQNCSKPLKSSFILLSLRSMLDIGCLSAPLCEERLGVCGEGICQQSLRPPYYSCRCGNFSSTFAKTIDDLVKCEESKRRSTRFMQNVLSFVDEVVVMLPILVKTEELAAIEEKAHSCVNVPIVLLVPNARNPVSSWWIRSSSLSTPSDSIIIISGLL